MNAKKMKSTVVALSIILVIFLTIAGTITYLQDVTTPVVNTFSPSNIGLTLTEDTGATYKMIPGVSNPKDPKVTVTSDIDSYVFVKIVEAGSVTVTETVDGETTSTTYTFDDFVSYAIADGWTVLTENSTDGNETVVIWRAVGANDSNKTFSVLANDKVTTNTGVTKQMMNAYTDGSIKLTFTAYAIQMADGGADNGGNFTPAEAWAAAQTQG